MQNQIIQKKSGKTKQRTTLSLPQANIKIGTFFNQKLNSVIDNSKDSSELFSDHISCPAKQKRFSFTVSPKYEVNTKFMLNFNDCVQKQHIFRKLIKYNSMNLNENKKKKNGLIFSTRFQTIGKIDKQVSSRVTYNILNNKRSVLLDNDHHDIIRRQLEEKFNRTRMIFKQQEKLKRYDKIHKIYDKKQPAAKCIKKGKTQKKEFPQSDKCSPWLKNRIESYQAEIQRDNEGFQN